MKKRKPACVESESGRHSRGPRDEHGMLGWYCQWCSKLLGNPTLRRTERRADRGAA